MWRGRTEFKADAWSFREESSSGGTHNGKRHRWLSGAFRSIPEHFAGRIPLISRGRRILESSRKPFSLETPIGEDSELGDFLEHGA